MAKSIRENLLFFLFLLLSVGYFSYNMVHPFLETSPATQSSLPEEIPAPADLVMEPVSPEKIDEFFELTKRLEFPTEDRMSNLSQDDEMKFLLQTAHQVLKVRQHLEKNEVTKELGFKLFLDCSLNPKVVKSFRSQCWTQAQQLYFDVFQKELDPSIVPVQIHRMASR